MRTTAGEYSYNDIMQMQEQAIRRAREMQQKARITVREAEATDIPNEDLPDTEPEKITVQTAPVQNPPMRKRRQGGMNGFLSLLSEFPADDDMAVILPILLMLLKEGADEKLILALIYIMT